MVDFPWKFYARFNNIKNRKNGFKILLVFVKYFPIENLCLW